MSGWMFRWSSAWRARVEGWRGAEAGVGCWGSEEVVVGLVVLVLVLVGGEPSMRGSGDVIWRRERFVGRK